VETDKTKFVELTEETHKAVGEIITKEKMESLDEDEARELETTDTIVIDKYSAVRVLLENLPNDFFSNWGHNPKWKYTTKILNGIGAKDIVEWLNESAVKSNGNFTEGQNVSWYESISATEQWIAFDPSIYTIKNHLDNIKKSFGVSLSYKKTDTIDTPLVRKWLMKWTGKSKQEIDNIYSEEVGSEISIGQHHRLYQKTMTLENTGDRTQRNYWIDNFSNKPQEKTHNFMETDRDTLIKQFSEDLENDTIKHIGINAKWGMRKTSLFIMTAISHYTKLGQKVIIPTESNSLNSEFYNKLLHEFPHLNIMTHQRLLDNKLSEFPKNTDITICSMESILKCQYDFDLIIFDEFESMVLHLESPTMSTKKIEPHLYLNRMKECGMTCKKIITLDADLTVGRQKPLLNRIGIGEDASRCYYMNDNKWLDYTFNIWVDNEGAFWEDMEKNIIDGKRVAIATLSAKKILTIDKNIYNLKQEEIIKSTKNTLVCCSEGWKYNGRPLMEIPKKDGNGYYSEEIVRENISEFIVDMEVDYWLYSPTIKTGISFDKADYFDVVYGKSNNFSCVAREFVQMLFRVREVKDSIINIHIDKFSCPKTPPIERQFRNCLTKNMSLPLYSLSKEEKEIDWVKLGESVKLCPLYEEWKIINLKERWLSQNNLPHEICSLLHHNHGLRLNFIHRTENPDIIQKLEDCKNLVKNEDLELLRSIPLLQPDDHSLQSKYKKPSQMDYQRLRKRTLINKLGKYSRKEIYDKKMIDTGEPTYLKQPLPIIEVNNLWGSEHTIDTTRYITYADLFHDRTEALEKILHPPAELNHINYNNDRPLPTKETTHQDLTTKLTDNNKWKMYYKFLSRFAPFIFVNEDTTTIRLTVYKLSVKHFKQSIIENEDWIKREMNDFILIAKNKLVDRDWSKFNATKSKDKKDFYSVFKSALGHYGLNTHAPKHKEADKQVYTIKPAPKLYYDKPHKDIDTIPLTEIKTEDKHMYTESDKTKTKKITTNNTKARKAIFKETQNVRGQTYTQIYGDKPIQLYPREITKWTHKTEGGNDWILFAKKETPTLYLGNIYYRCNDDYRGKEWRGYQLPQKSRTLKNYDYRKIEVKIGLPKTTINGVKRMDAITQHIFTQTEKAKVIDCIKNKDIEFLKFFLRYKPTCKKTLTTEEYKKINPIINDDIPVGICCIKDFEATEEEHPQLTKYYREIADNYNTYKKEVLNNFTPIKKEVMRPEIENIWI